MNCVKGDMAWIIRSVNPANYGKVFECVEFLGVLRQVSSTGPIESPCWRVSPPFVAWDGTLGSDCPDRLLRPIRDQPGADETLTWAGKPATINQPKETA